jgi:acylphosphatase
MTAICLHCYVSGHVQGVFFRREAVTQGRARGLTGWVRNTEDGRVEVMLCGEEQKVRDMEAWLWQGPKAAQVEEVKVEQLPLQKFTDFEVK